MKLTPIAVLATVSAVAIASWTGAAPNESLVDLEGRPVDPFAIGEAKALVLVFAGVDCPISNRYAPAINRLYTRFASQGFSFWMVYPGTYFNRSEVQKHREEYGIRMPALLDPSGHLVEKTGATVTPEVVVYPNHTDDSQSSGWIYRGRIDDRYSDFGKWRANANREDLKEVLESINSGERPPVRETKSIGCYIAIE